MTTFLDTGRQYLSRAMLMASLTGVALAHGTAAAQKPVFDRELSEAKPYQDPFARSSQTSRLDFEFGDARALLRRDGTWQVEAEISHSGFRCGSYRLGMRFGVGNPGCLDVQWFGTGEFVTNLKHCNNAERPHQGSSYDVLLGESFDGITCAERLIRCTGVCNMGSPKALERAPRFGE